MKKTFHILIVSVLSLLLLLVAVAIIVPLAFKDEIKEAVDELIIENVNAEVIYTTDNISLSFIRSFPNLRFSIDGLTVKNYAPFNSDTLMSIGSFQLDISPLDYLSNDNISVNKIAILSPLIHIRVLKNGLTNYDIIQSTSEITSTEENLDGSAINFSLDQWKIENARIYYEDSSINTFIHIDNLSQYGSARLKQGILNAKVNTSVEKLSAAYAKVRYLNKHMFYSNINFEVSKNNTLFTLRENEIKINELALRATGLLELLPNDTYKINMDIDSEGNNFKDFLSMIPAIYAKDFEDINTSGTLSIDAHVKGLYNDSLHQKPSFNLNIKVKDGYLKYPDLPLALEKVAIDINAQNTDGVTKNTAIHINNFAFEIANDPMSIKGDIQNLNNYKLHSKGKLNLANIKKVYPIEGIQMVGIFDFDINSTGSIDHINQSKYNLLKNQGNLYLSAVEIVVDSMPKVQIPQSTLKLDATSIDVSRLDLNIGKSDLKLTGKLTQYIDYFFTTKGVLRGNFNLVSNTIDLNEWMSNDEGSEENSSKEEPPSPPYIIPKNLDLSLNSAIDHITLMDMPIDDFKGNITLKNGILSLNKTTFTLLEGRFNTNGSYNTHNPQKPMADFEMDVRKISMQKAFNVFNTVKKLAPVAEHIKGYTNLSIKVTSVIGEQNYPIYESINGSGILKVERTGLEDFKLINQLSTLTSIAELKDPQIEATTVKFDIKDGKLITQPFKLDMGNIKSTLSGYTTIDGKVNYELQADIPAKEAKTYIKNLLDIDLSSYNFIKTIPLTIYFKGEYNKIKPSLVASKQTITEAIKNRVKAQAKQKTKETTKVLSESAQQAVKSFTDPNDKRSEKEKVESALEEGKKKLLNIFGNPK